MSFVRELLLAGVAYAAKDLLKQVFEASCFAHLVISESEEEFKSFDDWIETNSTLANLAIKEQKLTPGMGWYLISWNGKKYVAQRRTVHSGFSTSTEIEVWIPGGNKSDTRTLLQEVAHDPSGIGIYSGEYGYWKFLGRRQGRPLSTVSMPDGIIEDARHFLASRQEYVRAGVPHRLGFLFHGPPGTGKTSSIVALATEIRSSLYLVPSFSTDQELQRLVQNVPGGGIVVFEDVDCMFENNNKLSMAALLNVIDGVTDSDGRIMIMTTNHLEKIDPALVRPGRCDRRYNFDSTVYGEDRRAKLWSRQGDNGKGDGILCPMR